MRIVITVPDSTVPQEIESHGWSYEVIDDDVTIMRPDDIDALVSRTFSRAKKQYQFENPVEPPAELAAPVEPAVSPSVKALRKQIQRLEASREYRIGRLMLRPVRAVVRRGQRAGS